MPRSEKPLSDGMERALIAIVDLARSDRTAGVERQWHHHPHLTDAAMDIRGVPEGTVAALERRGLVETDFSEWPRRALVRATDAGIALCDSMGD